MLKRALTLIAVVLLLLAPLPGRATADDALVVLGGTLIDGTGGAPRPATAIIIRGGVIREVTTGEASIPADAHRIEARQAWIIPGLIDMHVHYEAWWMDDLFVRHGITTVRDVGANLDQILGLRRESREPGSPHPRLFACGPLLDGPVPRHGAFISHVVTTPEGAREVVRGLVARQVDCLKVYEQLTPPLVRAIAEEAKLAGIPVTAHLRDTPATVALEAGVRGLEHALGFPVCDERSEAEVARLVVERGAYLVPTLALHERLALLRSPEIHLTPLLSAAPEGRRIRWSGMAARASAERTDAVAWRLACLKRFLAGLAPAVRPRVAAGRDTPNPFVVPGFSLHRELELLVDSGFSPMEALLAATRTAAEFLGGAGALGTVEPGKAADLVVLASDPLASITAIRDVELVIRAGRVVVAEVTRGGPPGPRSVRHAGWRRLAPRFRGPATGSEKRGQGFVDSRVAL
jgi:imidazolonepropionase-like amidohydrolase